MNISTKKYAVFIDHMADFNSDDKYIVCDTLNIALDVIENERKKPTVYQCVLLEKNSDISYQRVWSTNGNVNSLYAIELIEDMDSIVDCLDYSIIERV